MPGETITFRCSNCNRKLSVPRKWRGRDVKCPQCKKPTRVADANQRTPVRTEKDTVLSDIMSLETSGTQVLRPALQPTAGSQRCPFCQGVVHVTAKKCNHCGERLQPSSPDASLPSTSEKSSLSMFTWIMLILAVVLFGGWVVSQYEDNVPAIAARPAPPVATIEAPRTKRVVTDQELVEIVKYAWGQVRLTSGGELKFHSIKRTDDIEFPYTLVAIFETRAGVILDHGRATYEVGFNKQLKMSESYTRRNAHYKLHDTQIMEDIGIVFDRARPALRGRQFRPKQ